MSANGPGVFDDDLTCDVRDTYRRLLQDRVPDDEATRQTIAGWADLGPDEEPRLWLALAATQSSVGRLDDSVLRRALEVIDTGRDLESWSELGDEWVVARAGALADLRARLTGPQPTRKAVRRPWRWVTDLTVGTVLAWRRSDGDVVVLRVVHTPEDRFTGSVGVVLQRLAWSGPDLPPPDQLASLPPGPDVVPPDPYGGRGQPGACIPFRWRKSHADWADVGFVVCGSVPPRDGDAGDWELHVPHMWWETLTFHLDQD
ncbi:hypothetical protein SAMN03159343_3819 [Klenkia marina]|uniref:Uncharacterized protein n=1 Tax=Klenkia marina TaxID=1960309 RepID=A0A1G4YZ08_9ACTN|nr:hypothetical protein [Klenkia marina]SCX58686.1 hypothetical protein SAMN03159343_3819 [Klenkia marina]